LLRYLFEANRNKRLTRGSLAVSQTVFRKQRDYQLGLVLSQNRDGSYRKRMAHHDFLFSSKLINVNKIAVINNHKYIDIAQSILYNFLYQDINIDLETYSIANYLKEEGEYA
jgi:hypothetical protein